MPLDPIHLPDISRGDPIPGEWLTALKNFVRQFSMEYGDNFIGDPIINGRAAIVEHWLGQTQDYAVSQSDQKLTDARYYVQQMCVTAGYGNQFEPQPALTLAVEMDFPCAVPSQSSGPSSPTGLTVTATNLEELGVNGAAGTHLLPTPTYVHVFSLFVRDTNWPRVYFFSFAPPPRSPFVDLMQTGGSSGGSSSTCSFTYTATYPPLGGTNIAGTGLSPTWNQRIPDLEYIAASNGAGVWSGTNFTLMNCDELPGSTNCAGT